MRYQEFSEMILTLKEQREKISRIYNDGVDLINFMDSYHKIFNTLILEIYGQEGLDNFQWFCYENNFGEGDLKAQDGDGNRILYDIRSLWWYLESSRYSRGQEKM